MYLFILGHGDSVYPNRQPPLSSCPWRRPMARGEGAGVGIHRKPNCKQTYTHKYVYDRRVSQYMYIC